LGKNTPGHYGAENFRTPTKKSLTLGNPSWENPAGCQAGREGVNLAPAHRVGKGGDLKKKRVPTLERGKRFWGRGKPVSPHLKAEKKGTKKKVVWSLKERKNGGDQSLKKKKQIAKFKEAWKKGDKNAQREKPSPKMAKVGLAPFVCRKSK